jgi:hypothetical protein
VQKPLRRSNAVSLTLLFDSSQKFLQVDPQFHAISRDLQRGLEKLLGRKVCNDLGGKHSEEGMKARQRLTDMREADHIMLVNGRYIDGRTAVNGAQKINAGLHGKINNAKFSAVTGNIHATTTIRAGKEILMAYSKSYWDEHKRAERILKSQEGKAGGFIAYTAHMQRRTSKLGNDNKTAATSHWICCCHCS